jgi:S1-C subfamily serine protease
MALFKQSPKAIIPTAKFLFKLLLRTILLLPKAIYNSFKFAALVLVCGYLALGIMGGLQQIPSQGVPSIQVPKQLPPLRENPVYDSQRAVVRLSVNGVFFCSGVVIGGNYILTASHCIVDAETGVMKDEVVTVEGDNGRVTVVAKPVGINLRMDWGLLHGNFTSIPAARLISTELTHEKNLKACGFPQGNHKVYCADLKQDGNDLFLLKTKGLVWPGMSGGPVFDPAGNVVALNIRGYDLSDKGGSGISPTLGILANFGIGD